LLAGVDLALLALVIAKNTYSLFHVGLQNWFSATCEIRLGTSLLGDVRHAAYGFTLTRNSAIIREIFLGVRRNGLADSREPSFISSTIRFSPPW
jgi:hypothetical protein